MRAGKVEDLLLIEEGSGLLSPSGMSNSEVYSGNAVFLGEEGLSAVRRRVMPRARPWGDG
jgi:hypothetical protein